MKNPFTVSLFLLLAATSFGQVMTGKVGVGKSQQPAAIIELPYATEVVESAIKDQLTRKGLRAEQSKGFMLFRNMQLVPSDTISSDLYFKVDRKNRRDNNLSVVYLVVAKKNENVADRNGESDYGMDQAKTMLTDLIPSVDAAGLEAQIKDQQNTVNKAERKYKDLVSDGQDLEKRRKDLENKISTNQRDQESQKLEVEKQKQAFDAMVSKRKS